MIVIVLKFTIVLLICTIICIAGIALWNCINDILDYRSKHKRKCKKLPERLIQKANELFKRVEVGDVKNEMLGNDALPTDGRTLYENYTTMLASNDKVELIISMKECAYHEKY